MGRILNNSQGFTIMEALISLAIVGISGLALTQMSSLTSTQYVKIRAGTDTSTLNQNFSEALLVSVNSDGSLAAGDHTQYFDVKGNAVTSNDGNPPSAAQFQVKWTVTPDTPAKGLLKVAINTGSARDGFQHRSNLVLYRPSPGSLIDRSLVTRPHYTIINSGSGGSQPAGSGHGQ